MQYKYNVSKINPVLTVNYMITEDENKYFDRKSSQIRVAELTQHISAFANADVVTVDNIRETRFSRNPKISRVLTEFGWLRELNEGVKKIFSDMAEGELTAPEYRDSANTVCLILKNGIDKRTAHRNESINESSLTSDERIVFEFIKKDSRVSQNILAEYTGFSRSKVQRILKNLKDKNVICRQGSRKRGNWQVLR